ncbi:hypothetical protein [Nevskia soli]|uniref:hypothetical protein n=1 Tax=Nevskia soli TaxID=418856 RepID=UPI0004A741FA|nr:hypothetical protein [Nevskia soli]
MKKALTILGGIFLLILLSGGALFAYMAVIGPKLDVSSKAYVDQTVRKVALNWSADSLIAEGCSDFHKNASDEQIHAVFRHLATLGKLTEYQGSKGEANLNLTPKGLIVTAAYQARASFEHGEARFNVTVLQVGGEWRILGFYVDSPTLMQ